MRRTMDSGYFALFSDSHRDAWANSKVTYLSSTCYVGLQENRHRYYRLDAKLQRGLDRLSRR